MVPLGPHSDPYGHVLEPHTRNPILFYTGSTRLMQTFDTRNVNFGHVETGFRGSQNVTSGYIFNILVAGVFHRGRFLTFHPVDRGQLLTSHPGYQLFSTGVYVTF